MTSTAATRALIRESSDRNQPTTSQMSRNEASEQALQENIRQVAYALWEKRGRPEGTAEEDWREAEQQICLLQEQTTVIRG